MLTMPFKIKITLTHELVRGVLDVCRLQVSCCPGLDGDDRLIKVDRFEGDRWSVHTIAVSDCRALMDEADSLRRWQQPRFSLEEIVVSVGDRLEQVGLATADPATMTCLLLHAATPLLPHEHGEAPESLHTRPDAQGRVEGFICYGLGRRRPMERSRRIGMAVAAKLRGN